MEAIEALVVGAGPAGLMAAAEMARAGLRVVVTEGMPTAGRKLLMAGKSGLNLTRDEPDDRFLAAYEDAAPMLAPMIAEFGPAEVAGWARGLGQEVFAGSTGRVFPVAMKASPLLRAWLAELDGLGVDLRTRWRWQGFEGDALRFATPGGAARVTARRVVLALGGASWPRLGSDAAWVPWLAARGVEVAAFLPANVGFGAVWSAHMARHFGQALKGVRLSASGRQSRGEVVLSARGIEGGGLYPLAPALRKGAALTVDLAPDRPLAEVAARLGAPGRETVANRLRKRLGLGPAALALLQECARPLPTEGAALAAVVKALPVPLTGPRPIAEAISSAGGVAWAGLTPCLGLRALPGVFAAGEMLDWEAPTGGYLLTACLATGRWAGRAAAAGG